MIPNLSKEMIDLLQQLRKRLRSEFGIELKLSQDDIVQKILQYVEKSKDQKTLLLFADLEDMMGISLPRSADSPSAVNEPEPKHVQATKTKRVYRGHVIEDVPSRQPTKKDAPVRMYRGQVVVA